MFPPDSAYGTPEISVIAWVNDTDAWNRYLLSTLHPLWGYMKGAPRVDIVSIGPEEGCRNLGEAYNLGAARARYPLRAYMHQDVRVIDPSFVLKADIILRHPRIGAVGFIGSTVDTGASWMHAWPAHRRGAFPVVDMQVGEPTTERVALVDGLGLVTREPLEWSEEYEGPHMAVEDYCMRVRGVGKEVWVVDSAVLHVSGGKVDESYWRSVSRFQRNWGFCLGGVPTPEALRAEWEEATRRRSA